MRKGWEIKKLGDVCDRGSSNVSQNQLEKEFGQYPIFGASGLIKNISFYHQAKPYLSIVKDGSGVGRVTKMNAYTSVIGTLQYLIPKEDIDLNYLYYNLISIDFKKYITGAAIPHIYFKDYKNEPFLWMPLVEQQYIVSILDEVFEAIDQAKENLQRNLQNAKNLFQSELDNVFTSKGNSWLEKKLGECCTTITKGSSPKWQGVNYVDKPGILFVTSENVGEFELLLEHKKYVEEKFNLKDKKSILKKGDVLTNIVGASIGRTAIYNIDDVANINQAVCILRCNEKILNNEYLTYILNSPFLKKIFHDNEVDNARANLSLGFFANLSIPFPSLKEQKKIVHELDTLSMQTKKLETTYQKKIDNLEELKKSILQKAFSGELTSPERALSPNDGHSPSKKKKVSSIKSPERA
ncbi:MAG: restriction endonuclease subunit S [Ferruginibacter sp.]